MAIGKFHPRNRDKFVNFLANLLGNRLMVGQTILAQAIDLMTINFPYVPKQPLITLEFFRCWKQILMPILAIDIRNQ